MRLRRFLGLGSDPPGKNFGSLIGDTVHLTSYDSFVTGSCGYVIHASPVSNNFV